MISSTMDEEVGYTIYSAKDPNVIRQEIHGLEYLDAMTYVDWLIEMEYEVVMKKTGKREYSVIGEYRTVFENKVVGDES